MHELSLSEREEPIPIWLTATTVLSMQLWGAQRRVPRCSSLSWRGLGVRGTRAHKETWTPWGLCWPGHRTPQLCPPWEQCWQPLCTQPPHPQPSLTHEMAHKTSACLSCSTVGTGIADLFPNFACFPLKSPSALLQQGRQRHNTYIRQSPQGQSAISCSRSSKCHA